MQSAFADIDSLLGSGRNDLWVFGTERNVDSKSVVVSLEIGNVPLSDWKWGGTGNAQVTWMKLYAERPSDWHWREIPAAQLGGQQFYHLSKYDDHSSFSYYWGYGFAEDRTISYKGAILSFSNGRLILVPNGLAVAREKYKLSDSEDFVGMVGDKVFFHDYKKAGQLFFFEVLKPEFRYKLEVPINNNWPSSWTLERVVQVFDGNRNGEITAQVWVKNLAWFSAKPRRDSAGIVLDLNTAIPVN
ncbi:hypothetical protein [Undibacterium squillarum]|uniref:hypothetical protein n=1 Tax=Undibacterium squillarum TaxID=1131567 RepID=UPI0035B49CD3